MSASTDQDPRVNTAPGTLIIPEGSPPPRIRLVEIGSDSIEEIEDIPVEALRPYSHTSGTTWIDVQGLGDEATLNTIGEILRIHSLALADAVNVPQRAKTQLYPEHVVMIFRSPTDEFDATTSVPQVCILIGHGYIVSFQERYFGFFDDVRERIRDPDSELHHAEPAFLAHALIDALVDRYYPHVEAISERLDDLEATIFANPSPQHVSDLHQLQRQITTLRRVARPQVEALHRMSRMDSPLIPESVKVFLLDVEDHAQQILGRLDSARDIATDMMGAVLATLGHRQNEVMKVLTLVGSIFIPLTFIAGIYGMNFEYMPELKQRLGYPLVIGVMIAVALGMVALFRAKGWIGTKSR
jgi:magnesium transporter